MKTKRPWDYPKRPQDEIEAMTQQLSYGRFV
jgi:hypothetical protein